jgi:phenylalanyl-tRNA synthetase beta chain
MKISYNWLKNYINLNLDPLKVSELLTDCGLEVESLEKVQSIKGGLEGIIIGEVKSKIKHPDADRLNCTTVDIGAEELLHIVCGAPNVSVGQKVPVATIGTTLYSGDESFVIKKSKIRGELSQGMICAEDELGLGNKHDGIMILDSAAKIGTPAKKYFNIQDDYVFEIGLTPNRADATSHIGVARDMIAVLNHHYPQNKVALKIPSVDDFKIDNNNRPFEIIIEDEKACPRYTGISISGIEIKESPDWLKNNLRSLGLKPINNIVDITNFVLFETGHPLHAFDADKIKGGKVVIKKLSEGANFTTLDGEERKLSANDLMICNESEGMCIAGVYGGIDSGVSEQTKNIFLECAYFDPATLRKTAKLHALQTDASFRFERGADPNMTVYAIKRAVNLFKELAGGEVTSKIIDVYPKKIKPWEIEINYDHVDRLIGKQIERKYIKNILVDLGIEILEEKENGLLLLIPTYKVDVTREADVIEEILRIYGYNNIEIGNSLKSAISYTQNPDKEKVQNLIADYLSSNAFNEIMNNSLTTSKYSNVSNVYNSEHNVKMLNPISQDLDVMRQSLLFGGLESIAYNQNRKNTDLNFYEFGFVYSQNPAKHNDEFPLAKYNESKHLSLFMTGNIVGANWYKDIHKSDFYTLKLYVNNILKRLGINDKQWQIDNELSGDFSFGQKIIVNNKILVEFGSLAKKTLKVFDVKQNVFYADFNWDHIIALIGKSKVQYKEIPKYPEVKRDLAILLDRNINFAELEKLAYLTEQKLLKSVSIFDIYEGKKIEASKKSYALSFILQDQSKTLTDKLVDKVMNKIMQAFEREFKAIIRK